MSGRADARGPADGVGEAEAANRTLAARKKELTVRLFASFLLAVERGETFEWRAFREDLEATVWEEALKLAEGNGREAAALVGVPYSTFMNRRRPGRARPADPGPGTEPMERA